ncbi:MAG: bifunctional UDP-N-acetylglucosamine diphosphorylase/glucosamine-1-phosphate N-acetyltransferase GlmU [Gammaproteobacteria bacterium]|nr:bifunctional UDP-N-acetylglucosamine diphosphorylase/glucosamine-1-phosphate N-acetyltransferase GlmU [Gammaproteobacteria bacterium]MBV8403878.1 bifunctional UDP-N-acetylglucosamine diphosphorylase/glucosamine-1-phosphate N-acetyltransferase GlmU [Gammaproteobacteria bacterium]
MRRREKRKAARRGGKVDQRVPHDPVRAGPLSIVILAAGEGRRMRSALPKVLQPLAGRPLLQHVIDTARTLAPSAVHVVYGHGGERVRTALGAAPVSWVLQAHQLGTGHAVLQAMPEIPDDHRVLVLYGDVPLISRDTLLQLLQLAGENGVSLLTARFEDPQGYGRIVRDARGLVRQIVEQKDASVKQLAIRECNTGVLVSPARALRNWLGRLTAANSQGEYYLTDVIAAARRDKVPVQALLAPEPNEVLGVNDKAQLARLESLCRGRSARELLLAGVTLADPARIDVRGTLTHGNDVFIDVNVIFEGRVALGDRVRIGAGCMVRDSEIGADTQVHPHCVIEGALIGPACLIGPFARLRPAATLGPQVHIGNFVEVKNAQLGASSKANHLAYVGDAEVGHHVNIGAGTIVANYDGAQKHQTIIGDDVHTGSNSVLVAPIVVGAGATIAAGSTVTHSVPAGKLTIARAVQATVEGWRRPSKSTK